MPNIRMIWWDYGRVLFTHLTDECMSRLGLISRPQKKPHEVFAAIHQGDLITKYDSGLINTREFLDAMQALLGFSDKGAFTDIWQRILIPNPPAWKLATTLRMNHYFLGVISNTNEMQARRIETVLAAGSIMQFKPRIYSYKERLMKPDPAIYELALKRANEELPWREDLWPSECLFLDDRIENVESFRAFGGYAIQYDQLFHTKTLARLVELGVRI